MEHVSFLFHDEISVLYESLYIGSLTFSAVHSFVHEFVQISRVAFALAVADLYLYMIIVAALKLITDGLLALPYNQLSSMM